MTADLDATPEERRLWADLYEALAHALEIMKGEGTGEVVLRRVATQQALADKALAHQGASGLQ